MKTKTSAFSVQSRGVFEKPCVVFFNLLHLRRQRAGETLQIRMGAEARKAFKLVIIGRQTLRLFIGDHLQPVLDSAEMLVGYGEVFNGVLRDPSVALQLHEHVKRSRTSELVTASAENELLRLHEELDLANASAPQFYIMARHRDFGKSAHGVNLAFHCMNVGYRSVVKVLAPDERREIGKKFCAHCAIAGDGRALMKAARSQFWPSVS